MESGRKSGYYAAILSGKEDRDLWSLNTAKHFVSLLCQQGMQVNLFASVSVRSCWDLVHSVKNPFLLWWESSTQTALLYLSSIHCGHFCHSKWQRNIWISVHHPFHVWLREVMTSIVICSMTICWCEHVSVKYCWNDRDLNLGMHIQCIGKYTILWTSARQSSGCALLPLVQ